VTVEAWLAFCATEIVLCFTPGPAVLFVVSVAASRGLRPGLGAALGILVANAVYFTLSATGVAAALVASRELFLAIQVAGAVYLVGVGLRMLLARGPGDARPAEPRAGPAFFRGLILQGANPKVLVFFLALLPQFIDPAGSLVRQTLILGASSVAIELMALAAYALVAVRARSLAGERLAAPLERLGGGILAGLGVRLALARSD
jgi:threonine/homoserine/homoserine lactone efflux protein